MRKLIAWCKEHWQVFIIAFFFAFIPLYPKLPVLDIVQTWVYIRLEDLLIAAVVVWYLLQAIRARAPPRGSLVGPIAWYWGIGGLVLLFSLFVVGPAIDNYFPHLAILHYLRRIEYMILFFVAYDITKRHKGALPFLIWVIGLTLLGVFIYGIGQKFFGFPAYLTMNEEFAKGIPLRLPPTARIAATFGGHYDLAAWLVFVIPILGSMVFGFKRLWQKGIFLVLAVCGLILLLLTASRISFGVYLVAISAMLLWHKKPLLIIPVIVASMLLLNSVSGASERFYKTFRFDDVIVDLSTGLPIGTVDKLEGGTVTLEQQEKPDEESLPKGSGFVSVPQVAQGPTKTFKTIEVYTASDLATGSGEIATVSGSFFIQKALVYDISITTRFQGQWPKAIEAFKRNILLGSGFSTLSVAADGDYLRMLGETGILGTIAFLGIFVMAFAVFGAAKKVLAPFPRAFTIGVFAGIVGLLFNAILIDVFEASKVAFSLWLVLGVAIAILDDANPKILQYKTVLWNLFTHRISYGVYLALIVFILYGQTLSLYFMGDDFTWLKWAAQTASYEIGTYFTDAQGFFYRPIPKLWYFFMYSFFWLKPAAYHVASLAMFSAIVLLVYAIPLLLRVRFAIAFAAGVLFAVLAVHHENIFWVSGQSSLLAALFFFAATALAIRVWHGRVRFRLIAIACVYVLLAFSMFSYDGMLIAPALLWVFGVWYFGKKRVWWLHGTLLLMPALWALRSWAGAVGAEGDYGYNPANFLVNAASNGVGYILASLGGPKVIEWFSAIREQMRSMRTLALAGLGGIAVLLTVVFVRFRTRMSNLSKIVLWAVLLALALLPYLGLGAMSERYALVATGILIIGLALAFERWWATPRSLKATAIAILAVCVLIGWNVRESMRLAGDWKKASDVSQEALLAIKTNFFPLTSPMSFRFYNTPIRYGRAWIFSTGMYDPLWHMFKFNGFPYETIAVATQAEAFDYQVPPGWSWAALGFEDYKLKRLVRQVETVEVVE